MKIQVNDQKFSLDGLDQDTPLLWVLRDHLSLTGTKFGCGRGACGACSVLVNGQLTRSCVTPVSAVQNKSIETIEGLAAAPKQQKIFSAWNEEQVPQCGYCQPGQIVATAALLQKKPKPSDNEINEWMSGNICRCGTYDRIHCAIRRAAGLAK